MHVVRNSELRFNYPFRNEIIVKSEICYSDWLNFTLTMINVDYFLIKFDTAVMIYIHKPGYL